MPAYTQHTRMATMTGRAGKRVDHSRQQKCLWRARGDSFHGDTRGFMLERIYRVPAAWKNVYDQYTDERALEDLASCARSGTLPWSHKVVRYDKLGIARPSNAVCSTRADGFRAVCPKNG